MSEKQVNKHHYSPMRRIVRVGLSLGLILSFVLSISFLQIERRAEAAPAGSLDTTFGTNGKVITSFDYGNANAVAIQQDGKIVAAGNGIGNIYSDFALARYNTDGTLDQTFDGDGKVKTDFQNEETICAVAIQPDGKIVAAGRQGAVGGFGDFALARYNKDGSLDTSFDGDGKVLTDLKGDGSTDIPKSMVLQPDGKIVVAGYTIPRSFSPDVIALARYNQDGSLDNTFGRGGKVLANVDNVIETYAVVIQPDGKLVVGGTGIIGDSYGFALVRFNINGSLDTSFGDNGSVKTPTKGSRIFTLKIQSDGKIVAGGGYGFSGNFVLARYNTDGSLDTSFDGDGVVITSIVNTEEVLYIALQPDGKIVAAGDFAVARYNTDGSLDTSFDSDGKAISDFPVNAVAIQTDGNIVVAGGNYYTFILARYLGNVRPIGANDNVIAPADRSGNQNTPPGIPANNYPSIINISGLIGRVSHISVVLKNITHTSPKDLDVLLVSPTGRRTILMSDALGDSPITGDGVTINIDQNAPSSIPESANFAGGYFKPVNYNGDETLEPNGVDNFPSPAPGLSDYSTASLDVFKGDYPNGDWKLYVVDDENGNVGTIGGWGLDITTRINRNNMTADFDGDGRTDLSVFRPSTGSWWIKESLSGQVKTYQFGIGTDRVVPADYDGDGKTDIAVWRRSNANWYIIRSSDSTLANILFGFISTNAFPFDTPIPADYDGDGKTDFAGTFVSGQSLYWMFRMPALENHLNFGISGDVPVSGNYDGDAKADIAIYRPSDGSWWVKGSSAGVYSTLLGSSTDKPVQADYTGDGKVDIAVFRPSTGEWIVVRSEDQSYFSVPFGAAGDIPVPGDYDGDGKADFAVFRPSNSTWFIRTSGGEVLIEQFGISDDKPVPSVYIP